MLKPLFTLVVLAALQPGCSDENDSAGDVQVNVTTATDTTTDTSTADTGATGSVTYQGEVWGDNWSSMYVGTTLVMEDSVPITTERSFNAEVFTFEATRPFLLNVVMKDYIENDSGLEYIGAGNQQMGDGGYIAQISEVSTGTVVAASNADWKCLTIHTAPLDKSCEGASDPLLECTWDVSDKPAGWKDEAFDDTAWVSASVYSEAAVSPKDGYDAISWDPAAALIWGADLETHNTVLCRGWVN
ncbi:MAG: hypothetical protein ACI9MR_001710 [Myxococcota bacterium]|jgi:hypothetical protein